MLSSAENYQTHQGIGDLEKLKFSEMLGFVSAFSIDWPVEKSGVEKYDSEMTWDELFFQSGVTS